MKNYKFYLTLQEGKNVYIYSVSRTQEIQLY